MRLPTHSVVIDLSIKRCGSPRTSRPLHAFDPMVDEPSYDTCPPHYSVKLPRPKRSAPYSEANRLNRFRLHRKRALFSLSLVGKLVELRSYWPSQLREIVWLSESLFDVNHFKFLKYPPVKTVAIGKLLAIQLTLMVLGAERREFPECKCFAIINGSLENEPLKLL
uniref:Cyclin N-terminal domain-containing protein n=1 Tax=Ascaris lumbricoides TaxID=6252 RepID=A0A9J2P2W9_ASCLU